MIGLIRRLFNFVDSSVSFEEKRPEYKWSEKENKAVVCGYVDIQAEIQQYEDQALAFQLARFGMIPNYPDLPHPSSQNFETDEFVAMDELKKNDPSFFEKLMNMLKKGDDKRDEKAQNKQKEQSENVQSDGSEGSSEKSASQS